jgi:hypothetical protein
MALADYTTEILDVSPRRTVKLLESAKLVIQRFPATERTGCRKMARQMIWGTQGIAVALFGPEHAHEHRRTLYSLIARGKIPTFRMGRTPCAWSDQLEEFLEAKAREAAGNVAAPK